MSFKAEVWADNWFSLYINGKLVGEDSVPITTVRSFNAETISFTATYPLTIAMISKDYEEATNGLEYIGTDRQFLVSSQTSGMSLMPGSYTGHVVAFSGSYSPGGGFQVPNNIVGANVTGILLSIGNANGDVTFTVR